MASTSRLSLGRTPESAHSGLRRKDSKHIVDTCHGITSNGAPCRRRLPMKDSALRAICIRKGQVVLPTGQDALIFLCWQHGDQSDILKSQFGKIGSGSQNRKSLESLFEDLALEEIDDEDDDEIPGDLPSTGAHNDHSKQRNNAQGLSVGDALHIRKPGERRVDVKAKYLAHDHFPGRSYRQEVGSSQPARSGRKRPRKLPTKHKGFFATLFGCVSLSEADTGATLGPRQRHSSSQSLPNRPSMTAIGMPTTYPTARRSTNRWHGPIASSPHHVNSPLTRSAVMQSRRRFDAGLGTGAGSNSLPRRRKPSLEVGGEYFPILTDNRQSRKESDSTQIRRNSLGNHMSANVPAIINHRHHSQPDTRQVKLSRLPLTQRAYSAPNNRKDSMGQWTPHLPFMANDTQRLCYAKLLTVMSQPPTAMDGDGYIYMFWQTELATTQAETDAAASIVSGRHSEADQAHDEEILRRRFFQTSANASLPDSARRTIFLKIGSAKNVHQRIIQWQKQCGYNISLLRYYPQTSRTQELTKVYCVKKVERLIHLHLEMLGYRVKRACRCGTEHREWFEIAGNTQAIREVDGIIGRWVTWADEKYASTSSRLASNRM